MGCGYRSKFQSTLPVRGATILWPYYITKLVFQSTLPVRGATPHPSLSAMPIHISIHAPRAGSDVEASHTSILVGISIHAPRAGSDRSLCAYANSFPISIHAPRAGSDPRFSLRIASAQDFNPRSPCGERPRIWWNSAFKLFQSTLPVRGATSDALVYKNKYGISIHAPRAGSDAACNPRTVAARTFQSTLPVRGAT